MALRDDQVRRYSRHVLLPELGGVAQARLLAGAVALPSLDGAGQAALVYLAAAGVGRIVVTDARAVDAPGPLFEAEDVGRPRREAARARVTALNPDASVVDSAAEALVVDVGGDDLGVGARAARHALRTLAQVAS
jgi:molybdopterin/thiamine biosynthesis adenylyltransferase